MDTHREISHLMNIPKRIAPKAWSADQQKIVIPTEAEGSASLRPDQPDWPQPRTYPIPQK
jgi:hypothetical protein